MDIVNLVNHDDVDVISSVNRNFLVMGVDVFLDGISRSQRLVCIYF